MNNDNLRGPLSPEEAREYGRRGGIKSGEARRAKRSMREMVAVINGMPLNEAEKKALKNKGYKASDFNQQTMFLLSVLKASAAGSTSAMRLWAELSEGVNGSGGEVDNGVTVNINIEDVSDNADDQRDNS